MKENKLHGVNAWVIHVVGKNSRENLLKVLKNAPLQFDSHVFGFFESNDGMIMNIFQLK